MLRKAVLILVLGNLLLWAWAHDAFRALGWAPARVAEPQRLQQQVHADAVELLDPRGNALAPAAHGQGAAAAAAPRTAPAHADVRTAPAPDTSASAAAPAHAASAAQVSGSFADCLRIGPYSGAPDAALGAALLAAGFHAEARRQALPEQWMVLMGPYADTATLQRKLAELHRLSLPPGSFIAVSARPRYMPGISLGVFDKREQAQLQRKRLLARGVQTAHVVQRNLDMQAGYWVLPALSRQQAQRLQALPALLAAHMHAQDCAAP